MKVLHYDPDKKAEILAEALVVLLSGGTVVYPTETAYALGADFFSPHAYRSIFDIKGRSAQKPLPVIVPDLHYATTIVHFSPRATRLAMKYWPGPLTLVLPFLYSKEWPHHGDDYLAVRVSPYPLATALAYALGKPLIATSANASGSEPSYSAEEVVRQFEKRRNQPDLVIDVGTIPKIIPSTVVRVTNNEIDIVRKGTIHLEL